MSAALGKYVALPALLLKDPVPLEDQVAEDADPLMDPFIVAFDPAQTVWFEPALTNAAGSLVSETFELSEHVPFVTFHFNVVVPVATPFTAVVFELGVTMVTPVHPLMHVHVPVPVAGFPPEFGLFAAMVKEPLLHCD